MYNITYTTHSQREPWDLYIGIIFSAVWYKFHDLRVRELCGTTNYLHRKYINCSCLGCVCLIAHKNNTRSSS